MESHFCPKCGAKVPEGDKFCENCGAALSREPGVQPSPQPAPPGTAAPPTAPPAPPPAASRPAKPIPRVALIGIGVIIVIAIIASAVLLLPKASPEPVVGSWTDDYESVYYVFYQNGTMIWWPSDMTVTAGAPALIHQLTWAKTGTGRYLVTTKTGQSKTIVFDSNRDVIYFEDDPERVHSRSAISYVPPPYATSSPTVIQPTATTTPQGTKAGAKFVTGDILIDTEDPDTKWIILGYKPESDEYNIDIIYPSGSSSYYSYGSLDYDFTLTRYYVDRAFQKVGHINPESVTVR